MLKKSFLMLSAAVMLGIGLAAPTPALAQFGPPPGPPPALAGPPPGLGAGGPPPGLGAGGPPPALGGSPVGRFAGVPPHGPAGPLARGVAGGQPRLDAANGLRSFDRGGRPDFRGVESRAAGYGANRYDRGNYIRSGYGRAYRYGSYAAAAAEAYGSSYASSDEGCYYASSRNGYRRVLVCTEN